MNREQPLEIDRLSGLVDMLLGNFRSNGLRVGQGDQGRLLIVLAVEEKQTASFTRRPKMEYGLEKQV
jgi:hypothetical protein